MIFPFNVVSESWNIICPHGESLSVLVGIKVVCFDLLLLVKGVCMDRPWPAADWHALCAVTRATHSYIVVTSIYLYLVDGNDFFSFLLRLIIRTVSSTNVQCFMLVVHYLISWNCSRYNNCPSTACCQRSPKKRRNSSYSLLVVGWYYQYG